MDRGNTKQEILEASLELFSAQGFEATSISQIAGAVGIRKASLYSHFENKQAILDALVKEVLEQYEGHSLFARADWENDAGRLPQTADDAVQMIQGQIRYILHDPATAHEWRSHLLDDYRRQEQGLGLPDGFVPSRTRWLTLDGRYAGTVNIRLRLSPQLERYGGHVGIVIRLGLRGQGLGTAAFPLAIAEAHRLGIREVLATCEADNAPSRRMLLHAGPARTYRRRADIDGVERDVCHFWYVV